MKKLTLKLDDLAVETFSTAGTRARPGTVHGYNPTTDCGTATRYVSCNFTACPLDCSGFAGTECCTATEPGCC